MVAASSFFPARPSRRGEPPWELLEQFPRQGDWSVEQYLRLPEDGRLIEFNDGVLEGVPMPDWFHQELSFLLCDVLRRYVVDGRVGRAVLPPFHFKTGPQTYRYPDLMYLSPANLHRFHVRQWTYADLVIEIVSPDDPQRDHVEKRAEYARAGVPEYWIIDPGQQLIHILSLDAGQSEGVYVPRSVQPLSSRVCSVALPGIDIDFAALVAQASATSGE
jgi:Uma2 family endonuclease